jgi:hypothetical protein
MRSQWIEDEFVITLAFYCFNRTLISSKKAVDLFTKDLNNYTGLNKSSDSIGLRFANYQSLDPDYPGIGLSNGGIKCSEYWNRYINTVDGRNELAMKYAYFLDRNVHEEGSSSIKLNTRCLELFYAGVQTNNGRTSDV